VGGCDQLVPSCLYHHICIKFVFLLKTSSVNITDSLGCRGLKPVDAGWFRSGQNQK